MTAIYSFRRGETIVLAIDAVQGDVGAVSAAAARIRRLNATRNGFATNAQGIAMAIASRGVAGDVPAGWTLTLAPEASALLEPGHYGVEARLNVGGGVIKTDFATVKLIDAA